MFFLSGVASLVLETVFRRQLVLSVGSAVTANSTDVDPGIVGHVAGRKALTPVVECVELDDARLSVLLKRSFGLAAQVE